MKDALKNIADLYSWKEGAIKLVGLNGRYVWLSQCHGLTHTCLTILPLDAHSPPLQVPVNQMTSVVNVTA